MAETQRRADGIYTYDPSDWRWNRNDFDTPPNAVGGCDALVDRLSYPESLRRRRIEGRGAAWINYGFMREPIHLALRFLLDFRQQSID